MASLHENKGTLGDQVHSRTRIIASLIGARGDKRSLCQRSISPGQNPYTPGTTKDPPPPSHTPAMSRPHPPTDEEDTPHRRPTRARMTSGSSMNQMPPPPRRPSSRLRDGSQSGPGEDSDSAIDGDESMDAASSFFSHTRDVNTDHAEAFLASVAMETQGLEASIHAPPTGAPPTNAAPAQEIEDVPREADRVTPPPTHKAGPDPVEVTIPREVEEDEFTQDVNIVTHLRHIWPKIPSTKFDVSDYPDPSRNNTAAPGSIRWRIHSKPPSNADEIEAATLAVVRQLVAHNRIAIRPGDINVSFPPTNDKKRYVEVTFSTLPGFQAGRTAPLQWRQRPFEIASMAAPLEDNEVLLKINHLRSTTDLNKFFGFLRRTVEHVITFKDLWACFTTYEWKVPADHADDDDTDTLPPRRFTGTVMILATYIGQHGPNELPGFIKYDNLEQYVHFEGRGDRCSFCKASARPAHTFEQCTWKECIHCRQRGHMNIECPLRPSVTGGNQSQDFGELFTSDF